MKMTFVWILIFSITPFGICKNAAPELISSGASSADDVVLGDAQSDGELLHSPSKSYVAVVIPIPTFTTEIASNNADIASAPLGTEVRISQVFDPKKLHNSRSKDIASSEKDNTAAHSDLPGKSVELLRIVKRGMPVSTETVKPAGSESTNDSETDWDHFSTEVTYPSTQNPVDVEEEFVPGLDKSVFITVVSASLTFGVCIALATMYYIRRRRLKYIDSECQRLIPFRIATGIYYNQTGSCF